MERRRVLVTGHEGFVGHHLALRLARDNVIGVADIKTGWDLKHPYDCWSALHLSAAQDVYHLAADMGGIGYIGTSRFGIATGNALIDASMLRASVEAKVERFFYASSACVYPVHLQEGRSIVSGDMHEGCAWMGANPEPGYGLEKLFAEELCRYAAQETSMQVRIARFHNVYGPSGTWQGGKEKSVAALCRKVALAQDGGEVEVWGDGQQVRSYCYIDDCVEGIVRLMASPYQEPLNIGSDHAITLDELVYLIAQVAGKTITIKHVEGPQGVRYRNSDNRRIREVLGWEPTTRLEDGLRRTYEWIAGQIDDAAIHSERPE